MAKRSELFPFIVCGSLIVLSGLLVVLGHRQGDALAAKATPVPAVATVAGSPTSISVEVTVTPGPPPAAASALAKPAAAD